MEKIKDDSREKLVASLLGLLKEGVIERGELLEFVEYSTYKAAMKFTGGNQAQGAKVLGVARGTLRIKLKKFFSTVFVGGLYHISSSKKSKQNQTPNENVLAKDISLMKESQAINSPVVFGAAIAVQNCVLKDRVDHEKR